MIPPVAIEVLAPGAYPTEDEFMGDYLDPNGGGFMSTTNSTTTSFTEQLALITNTSLFDLNRYYFGTFEQNRVSFHLDFCRIR